MTNPVGSILYKEAVHALDQALIDLQGAQKTVWSNAR